MAVRSSFVWMAFGQASYFGLQFVGSIVVARLLGPYDMGVFAIAMAVIGMIGVVQMVGLNTFLIREPVLTPEIIATAATVNLAISALMAVVIGGLGLAGDALFAEPGVRSLLLLLAVVPLIGQFAFVPNALLERDGAFKTIATIKAASTAFGMALTIILALKGFRYMSLGYSQVATALLTNIAINIIARQHVSFRLSLAHWSAMSRFGGQIFAVSGLTRVASRLMELVLGRTLGVAALGLYSRASSNHAMVWDSIHGVVARVVFADFSRCQRENIPLGDRYLKVLELMTGILWPLFAGVAILAGPAVQLIYGRDWSGAAVPLSLLCIASMVLVSTTMSWEVFVVRGETGRQARFEFIRTIFGTTIFVAACFHSLAAAAATRIADALFAQYLYRPHLERMTGTKRSQFGAVYLRSGIAAVAAVAPALGLMIFWRFSVTVPIVPLGVAVAAGGLAWLLAMRSTDHVIYHEMRTALRRLRGSAAPAT
ncbi:oligosaccharide flippase family protein [Sphingosinicellaceae bacterium]|nr:oligosaccharide flippase family protein [Sphingosinicellaceae bacterium]